MKYIKRTMYKMPVKTQSKSKKLIELCKLQELFVKVVVLLVKYVKTIEKYCFEQKYFKHFKNNLFL